MGWNDFDLLYEYDKRLAPWNRPELWNDYEYMKELSYRYAGVPYLGGKYSARVKELEDEENARYWSDYEKNTGVNLSDNPYPIRSGYYSSGVTSSGFDVNYAIMAMYNGFRKYKKW